MISYKRLKELSDLGPEAASQLIKDDNHDYIGELVEEIFIYRNRLYDLADAVSFISNEEIKSFEDDGWQGE
jgi:hypothetical protein